MKRVKTVFPPPYTLYQSKYVIENTPNFNFNYNNKNNKSNFDKNLNNKKNENELKNKDKNDKNKILFNMNLLVILLKKIMKIIII
jgi:hypothetical protein